MYWSSCCPTSRLSIPFQHSAGLGAPAVLGRLRLSFRIGTRSRPASGSNFPDLRRSIPRHAGCEIKSSLVARITSMPWLRVAVTKGLCFRRAPLKLRKSEHKQHVVGRAFEDPFGTHLLHPRLRT